MMQSIPMEELLGILRTQMERGGMAHLVVTGFSMYPTFRHRRDQVLLVEPKKAPKRPDVILYRRDDGRFVLHRIVRMADADTYICSGDNQWQPERVRRDQVIALVDGFVRNNKEYSLDHPGYRLWVRFWVGIFPVRRPFLAMRRFLGKIKRKFRRK